MEKSNIPPVNAIRKDWTILSLINWATTYLQERGFDEARLNVELLLAGVLQIERIGLYTNFDRPLNEAELSGFKALFKRRLEHEPVQYILGETEFMGLPFWVSSAALIPRPETELLVERAVELLKQSHISNPAVLDIGTGSGNVAVATAALMPGAMVTSIDCSVQALELAAKNAERNGIQNVSFLSADVMHEFLLGVRFDVIVSNPPYVSLREYETLQPEVRTFEPRLAVTDEGDGYRFLERIINVAPEKLSSDGVLLCEIAYNQAERIREMLSGWNDVRCIKDYSGIDRIIEARKS